MATPILLATVETSERRRPKVNGTMHTETENRAPHLVARSPAAWVLTAIVVLFIAIALAAGPAASAVRAPAGTPTPAPTVCTAGHVTGPCS
jgi:multisubunit Na+/H+ antiporter MnhC subunit